MWDSGLRRAPQGGALLGGGGARGRGAASHDGIVSMIGSAESFGKCARLQQSPALVLGLRQASATIASELCDCRYAAHSSPAGHLGSGLHSRRAAVVAEARPACWEAGEDTRRRFASQAARAAAPEPRCRPPPERRQPVGRPPPCRRHFIPAAGCPAARALATNGTAAAPRRCALSRVRASTGRCGCQPTLAGKRDAAPRAVLVCGAGHYPGARQGQTHNQCITAGGGALARRTSRFGRSAGQGDLAHPAAVAQPHMPLV